MDTHSAVYKLIMADSSQNASGLTESTNSTIFALNESVKSKAVDESVNNSYTTVLSQDSSIQLTDSSHVLEDFSGFSEADQESDVKDPFNSIFYHVMPLKESTNIIFYNRPLYNNILSVLSKEFGFPANDTRKFQIKTRGWQEMFYSHRQGCDVIVCQWTRSYFLERKQF